MQVSKNQSLGEYEFDYYNAERLEANTSTMVGKVSVHLRFGLWPLALGLWSLALGFCP
jgi:hypothetical protein